MPASCWMDWSKRCTTAGQFITAAWFIIVTEDRRADSTGRRNALFVDLRKALVKGLSRCFPSQRFARSAIDRCGNGRKHVGTMRAEIDAFWKVLAQQPVGVLVGAALPRALWVAEADLHPRVSLQTRVLGHLRALIPGERPSQFFRQADDGTRDRIPHCLRAVPGQCRRVLDAQPRTVTFRARQVQQHREAGGAFDQRADRRAAKSEDEAPYQ
ncbi:MAG: hypothetical protein JWR80_3498 [Bradyrhizobium sp.]|nr:hypothetical protein [Bradyrhizobium sp.]